MTFSKDCWSVIRFNLFKMQRLWVVMQSTWWRYVRIFFFSFWNSFLFILSIFPLSLCCCCSYFLLSSDILYYFNWIIIFVVACNPTLFLNETKRRRRKRVERNKTRKLTKYMCLLLFFFVFFYPFCVKNLKRTHTHIDTHIPVDFN